MGEAFDELFLRNDEDDEDGNGGHRRGGKLDVPHRPAIGVGNWVNAWGRVNLSGLERKTMGSR